MSDQEIPNVNMLRPSSLPKLAECPAFHPTPFEAGPPAQRGTLMDEAYRFALDGNAFPLIELDDKIEGVDPTLEPGLESVQWAIDMTRLIAGGDEVITDEEKLHIDVPGIPSGGTMDGLIPAQNTLIDLKSGQIRNYMEQMAAYALGCMDKYFADTWTAKLIFCDQRVVVTHQFTYENAKAVVEGTIASQNSPDRKPQPCEYCGWCALKESCGPRRELATKALSYGNLQERWETILDDPDELGGFLIAADVLNDFIEAAKKRGVQHFRDGGEVTGYSLVNRKGNESVDKETLVAAMREHSIDPAEIIRAQGNISGKKFRSLVEGAGGDVRPTDIREGFPSSFIKKKPVKKKKAVSIPTECA